MERVSTERGLRYSADASGFVLLSEAAPEIILEIRYAGVENFVGVRIDGYLEPAALLTREAAAALAAVSADLAARGLRLKVFDAYRPRQAVAHFLRWAQDPADTRMKAAYYPELEKDALIPLGYIAEESAHSRGSAVDLTLCDDAGQELDMGSPFDRFGPISRPDYPGITAGQRKNRLLLREAMLARGFRPLAEEWWHFTLENEPYPDTCFTFPVSRSVLDRA